MSERRPVCGGCRSEIPVDWMGRNCPDCGRSLVGSSEGESGSFIRTMFTVVLLWLGTPALVAITLSIAEFLGLFGRQDPESGAMPVNNFLLGTLLGTLLLYAVYFFVGVIAGLIMLFTNKRIGAGVLAGTGLGSLSGSLTCLALVGSA